MMECLCLDQQTLPLEESEELTMCGKPPGIAQRKGLEEPTAALPPVLHGSSVPTAAALPQLPEQDQARAPPGPSPASPWFFADLASCSYRATAVPTGVTGKGQ